MVKLFFALLAEYLGKTGITLVFTKREGWASLFSFLSNFLFKGNRRGSLLAVYIQLQKNNIKKAEKYFLEYQRKLKILSQLADKFTEIKFNKKSLVPRIFSLVQTWKIGAEPPRQIHNAKKFYSNNNKKISFKSSDIILHVIAEDHEWSNTPGKSYGKNYLSLYEARIQLVEKGKLVNKICNEVGVPWTHLIDYGSYLMIKKAAEFYPKTWGILLNDFHDFLIDTLKTNNDLGLHVHPDKSYLAADSFEENKIYLKRENLKSWGELEGIGSEDDSLSKFGMIIECKRLIESYARKIDPNFEAKFFRAGRYSFGANIEQTRNSIKALIKAGIFVSSDALLMDGITESLGRLSNECVYISDQERPWLTESNYSERPFIQALPLRTKYLSSYCVMDMARIYKKKPKIIEKTVKEAQKGQGYLISIDHDIDIGFSKFGGNWDSLDENSGDWKFLKDYLYSLSKNNNVKCIKANALVEHLISQLHEFYLMGTA